MSCEIEQIRNTAFPTILGLKTGNVYTPKQVFHVAAAELNFVKANIVLGDETNFEALQKSNYS